MRDVDAEIDRGEFVAVVGPSGSGKTTLLQLLGGLDKPSAGEVALRGPRPRDGSGTAELTALRLGTFGFVFQQFNLIPTVTAEQNVEVALAPRGLNGDASGRLPSASCSRRSGSRLAATICRRSSPGASSSAWRSRARSPTSPGVLLADEPTGNLDSTTGEEIIALLRSLSVERAHTIVLITHDVEIAAEAPRVIRMQDGRLLGATEKATEQEARL